jgi:hypothetical protein
LYAPAVGTTVGETEVFELDVVVVAAAAAEEEVTVMEMLIPAGAYMFRALGPPQYSAVFPSQVIVQAELPGFEPA